MSTCQAGAPRRSLNPNITRTQDEVKPFIPENSLLSTTRILRKRFATLPLSSSRQGELVLAQDVPYIVGMLFLPAILECDP